MAEKYKKDDSVAEETSAFGERVKGATKDAVGAVTGNRSLEREGERENAEGRARQANNDVFDETDGVRGRTVGGSRNLVTGVYDSPETAGRAYQDLTTRHGYRANDISVLMSDETRKRHFGDVRPGQEFKEGSKAAEGAGIGAGAGGATGTLVGALIGAGIPEDRASEYERGIKEGGIVLGTRARDDAHAQALERDFTGYGARNILR